MRTTAVTLVGQRKVPKLGDWLPRDRRILTLDFFCLLQSSRLIPGMLKTLRYPKVTGKCRGSQKFPNMRLIVLPKAMILSSKLVAEVSRCEGHPTVTNHT